MVGRWWTWPTAGPIACVALVLWSVASVAPMRGGPPLLLHHAAPFTLVASVQETESWHFGGSLGWRVVYLAGLCVLAACAACAHGMGPAARRRFAPWVVGVLVVTVAALLLAVVTGGAGYLEPWDERWTGELAD